MMMRVYTSQEHVALLADEGTCDQAALAVEAVHDAVFVTRIEGGTTASQQHAPFVAWLTGIRDRLHTAIQQVCYD